MGLSRTVFEINGDFSRKWQTKIQTRVLCAPADSLGIGYRRTESKTRMMGLPDGQKSS